MVEVNVIGVTEMRRGNWERKRGDAGTTEIRVTPESRTSGQRLRPPWGLMKVAPHQSASEIPCPISTSDICLRIYLVMQQNSIILCGSSSGLQPKGSTVA